MQTHLSQFHGTIYEFLHNLYKTLHPILLTLATDMQSIHNYL